MASKCANAKELAEVACDWLFYRLSRLLHVTNFSACQITHDPAVPSNLIVILLMNHVETISARVFVSTRHGITAPAGSYV